MIDELPQMTPIEPPRLYRGAFHQASERHLPLLQWGRAVLRDEHVPAIVQEHYLAIVDGHAQPSFVLFPLMYLDLAEATGGVTEQHRRYLPWHMLAMELVAIFDDTIDYTPMRSGSPTFAYRYGAAAAAAASGFVYSRLVERTFAIAPELGGLLTRAFDNLCAHEVWEHEARYPEVSKESFAGWIRTRSNAIPPLLSYCLDGSLTLAGVPRVPDRAHRTFGDLQQDVDDLVNIVEAREQDGENDDLKLGIPSYPVLAVLEKEPAAARLVDALWKACRARAAQADEGRAASYDDTIAATHAAIVELVHEHGVRATVNKVIADAESVAADSPIHARERLRAYAFSIVDRLRDVDSRARIERHV